VQPNFENARDHWALDDVSVFHRFKPKWHSTEPFKSVKADARAAIHVAQCCLGTIQCQLRLSPDDKRAQCVDVPGFIERMADIDPILNGSPLYLLTAFSFWLARALYRWVNSLVAHCSVAQIKKLFCKRCIKPDAKVHFYAQPSLALAGPRWPSPHPPSRDRPRTVPGPSRLPPPTDPHRPPFAPKVYTADEPPPASRDFERRFTVRVQSKFQNRITVATLTIFLGAAGMAFVLTPNTSTPVLGPLSGYLEPIQRLYWEAATETPIHVHQVRVVVLSST